MRVLLLTHAYPRWDGDVAGTFIQRLAGALHESGVTVEVATPSDQGRSGVQIQNGVTVRRVRYAPAAWETLAHRGTMAEDSRSLRGKLAGAGMLGALAGAVTSGDAELVHAHWWIPAGVGAWLGSRLSEVPYAVTLHGTDVRLLENSGFYRGLARSVLNRASAVTTVSSYLADEVAALVQLDRSRILVQPMPIPTEQYGQPSAGGGGIVIVGRLVAQKRTDLLLSAVASLEETLRPTVTVIGDGPERPSLENRVRELGMGGRVVWRGAVPPADLREELDDADLLLFGGQSEGLGLAVAEALLSGIPVVTTSDSGGALDLMVEGAGRIAEPNPRALAEAVTSVLNDPEALPGAVRAGNRLRARFSPPAVARSFQEIYRECAGGRTR